MPLLLLFVYPLTELLLWLMLAEVWGWSGNLLEVLVSGVLGAFLIRSAGFGSLARLKQAVNQGKSPALQVLKTFCFLLGGFLLILPGVLSDFFGLLLILPPSRYLMTAWMARSWARSQRMWVRVGNMGSWGGFYTASRGHSSGAEPPPARDFDDVIEVEAVDVREIRSEIPKNTSSNSSTDS